MCWPVLMLHKLRYTTFRNFHHTPRFTVAEFYTQCVHAVCPLALVVGFQPSMIRLCYMHAIHLGVCQWVNASAIHLLIDHGYLGDRGCTLQDHLTIFNRRLNKWCSMARIRRAALDLDGAWVHVLNICATSCT